jgi:hypothetical protein
LISDVVLGEVILWLFFVGIRGGIDGGLNLRHLLGSLWMIGDKIGILLSLIAVFCLTVARWMSSGGIAASISSAYIGEVQNAAQMSLSALFCILMRGLICDLVPAAHVGAA